MLLPLVLLAFKTSFPNLLQVRRSLIMLWRLPFIALSLKKKWKKSENKMEEKLVIFLVDIKLADFIIIWRRKVFDNKAELIFQYYNSRFIKIINNKRCKKDCIIYIYIFNQSTYLFSKISIRLFLSYYFIIIWLNNISNRLIQDL